MKTQAQVVDVAAERANAMIVMGFSLHGGEVVAVQQVQRLVEDAKDPLASANRIITQLGCSPVLHPVQARIIAKALVQQYVRCGALYEPDEAMKIAAAKYIDMERTMPFLFVSSDSATTPLTNTPTGADPARIKVKKPKRGGDKKERALEIFNKYAGKEIADSDIAKDIAKELEITFANAYYYVTRVFRKKYGGGAPKKERAARGSKKKSRK